MKNLLIVVAALFAVGVFAAVSPPVHQLLEGQVSRSDGVYLGTSTKPLKTSGHVNANVAAAAPQDGGTTSTLCQFGHKALANGDAGVTFRNVFSSIPSCTCSDTNVATVVPCNVTTASTIAIGMSVQSAGTDVVHYICCGDL